MVLTGAIVPRHAIIVTTVVASFACSSFWSAPRCLPSRVDLDAVVVTNMSNRGVTTSELERQQPRLLRLQQNARLSFSRHYFMSMRKEQENKWKQETKSDHVV